MFVDTDSLGLRPVEAIDRLRVLGVGATHAGGLVRMVTHLDIDDEAIQIAIDAWRALVKEV